MSVARRAENESGSIYLDSSCIRGLLPDQTGSVILFIYLVFKARKLWKVAVGMVINHAARGNREELYTLNFLGPMSTCRPLPL